MDILDTPWDWIQLVFSAVFFVIWSLAITYLESEFKIPNIIASMVSFGVFWNLVYDYDLIIGYFIGAVMTVFYARKKSEEFKIQENTQQEHRYDSAFFVGIVVGITMVVKMVFFFK